MSHVRMTSVPVGGREEHYKSAQQREQEETGTKNTPEVYLNKRGSCTRSVVVGSNYDTQTLIDCSLVSGWDAASGGNQISHSFHSKLSNL